MALRAGLAFCVLVLCAPFSSGAVIKSYENLSAEQIAALQESSARLETDDRALLFLEKDLIHEGISYKDYHVQEQELVACISEEASLQNVILTKQSTFPEHSDAVLRTIGKYSIQIPLIVLEAILKGGGNFSP